MTHHFHWHGRQFTIYKRQRPRATTAGDPWYFKLDNLPRSLQTSITKQAVENAKLRLDQRAAGRDQYKAFLDTTSRRAKLTVAELLTQWATAGHPDRTGAPRAGKDLDTAKAHVTTLTQWWATKHPGSITSADAKQYHAWRQTNVTRGTGTRTTKLELSTLRAVLDWAVENRHIAGNPISKPIPFKEEVHHCREFMPANQDELHNSTRALIRLGETVAGGRAILQAFSGLRCAEALKLRWDAKPLGPGAGAAGLIEGTKLYVARCKSGVNPFVLIHPALEQFISAWRAYTLATWPDSPWWFPDPTAPLLASTAALSKALQKVAPEGCHRTAHALRAYYVWVRRGQSIADAQIAAELGQSSGAQLIVNVYGATPPGWFGGESLGWLPKEGEPAWTSLPNTEHNIVPMATHLDTVATDLSRLPEGSHEATNEPKQSDGTPLTATTN